MAPFTSNGQIVRVEHGHKSVLPSACRTLGSVDEATLKILKDSPPTRVDLIQIIESEIAIRITMSQLAEPRALVPVKCNSWALESGARHE